MKVLHVIPSVSSVRGGPSEGVLGIARALGNHGVETEIVTTNDNGEKLLDVPLGRQTRYKEVPVRFFSRFSPSVRFLREYAISAGLTEWLWRHIKEYDIVHVHALFSYSTTIAMAISRLKGVPYIVRPNGILCKWSLNQQTLQKNVYLALIERSNINASHMVEFNSVSCMLVS